VSCARGKGRAHTRPPESHRKGIHMDSLAFRIEDMDRSEETAIPADMARPSS